MTRHSLRLSDYLAHMLEAARQIQAYTRDRSASDFLADRMLQDAVIRNIEVLGEAARRVLEVLPDAEARFPSVPFTAIYAMRNQLAHGYFSVDLDLVWSVIERDIPPLKQELERAAQQAQGAPPDSL